MLFGDNMFVGNTAVDAAYLGDTQVWSAIPADVKAHIARVLADGGTVPEQAKMVATVKNLIAANLWNNCVFFGLPLGGVKKDGNQFVSKVYDLRANADLLQSTATKQPKYDNGSLLYDGGDNLASGIPASGNPIQDTVGKMTIAFWSKVQWNGLKIVFSSELVNNAARKFSIRNNSANAAYQIYLGSNAGGFQKLFTTPIVDRSNWHHVAFTFDNTAMDGSVVGLLKAYINGQEVVCTKGTNLDLETLHYGTFLSLGTGLNVSSYYIPNGSQTALHQIYNSTLTSEQILWNFNNIRPEGV